MDAYLQHIADSMAGPWIAAEDWDSDPFLAVLITGLAAAIFNGLARSQSISEALRRATDAATMSDPERRAAAAQLAEALSNALARYGYTWRLDGDTVGIFPITQKEENHATP